MKNSGSFRLLNLQPKMLISYEDLEAIKHIVDIAPQEAQWFHRVEKIVQNSNVYYRIYEMYIPEQICSSVQVESDPMMMVNFYKELKEKHGAEKTNQIMGNLTAWCHSHHNMGVSPSGQDVKQFAEQCKNALDAKVNNPQIMMIFNKKDSFYSKVFDPEYGLVFEHVPFEITTPDYSWINKEAKEKFKKPKVKSYTKGSSFLKNHASLSNWKWDLSNDDDFPYDVTNLTNFVDDHIASIENQKPFDVFSKHYKKYNANKNLKRFLKVHVDPTYMKILNDAITYEVDVISDLLKTHINIPATLDEIYNEFFDNLKTEKLEKYQMEAAVVFASLYYEELKGDADLNTLDGIIDSFIEAFSTDTLGNETPTTWRF